jgi:hypothetical protein
MKKVCALFLAILLAINPFFNLPLARAQQIFSGLHLPPVGQPLVMTPTFNPGSMDGMLVYPENPFRFDFLFDKGDEFLPAAEMKILMTKQVRYFLSALTVREKDLWVNLSPYEKNRVLPDSLAKSDFGKDLLAQDYLLKQMVASLTYPESGLGKDFWDGVLKKLQERFGTTEVPFDALGKVWIVPQKAVLYEKGNKVFVVESRLKILSEKDFMATEMAERAGISEQSFGSVKIDPAVGDIAAEALRTIVIPELEKEVNTGKNFANLRQMYQAVILASWYKSKLKESVLSKVYVDRSKTGGMEAAEKDFKENLYGKYLSIFQSGAYSLIKEVYDPLQDEAVAHKYVSGGVDWAQLADIRQVTADEQAFLASGRLARDHAMATYMLTPLAMDRAQVITDIRQSGVPGSLPVYGNPSKFELWAKAVFPRPVNRVNNKGEMVAFWAMINALSEIILQEAPTQGKPFTLDRNSRTSIIQQLSVDYQLSNITSPELGFGVDDLFDYLLDLGFLRQVPNDRRSYYVDEALKPLWATWARLNSVIGKELDAVFGANGQLNESVLLDLIRKYDAVASGDKLDLVEPFQPFLRAVLDLSPDRRRKVIEFLYQRFFEGEKPSMTGGMMVDAILLMFDRLSPEETLAWGRKVFPYLTQKGRTVYLGAAEITLLKGGLGRVMQYLGRALAKMGVSVVFTEARYDVKVSYDQNGDVVSRDLRKYEELSIPLKMPPLDEKAFTYSVHFNGEDVEMWAYEAVNDEGIPVLTYRDKDGKYIQDVYYEGPGSFPADVQALFQAKAMMGAIQAREERRREAARNAGLPVPPAPGIGFNDGQVLMATVFRLFDPKYQADSTVLAHMFTTGHTVKNTIQVSQDALRQADIPEDYWWMLKNKGIYGNEVYDASKGGMTAAVATGGVANNVAANHRVVMDPYMAMMGGVVHGVTNGDLLPLTMREWNRVFVKLGLAGDENKAMLQDMEDQMNALLDPFQKAEARNHIDNVLFRIFWKHWDDPTVTDTMRMEWIAAIKKASKKMYFTMLLSDPDYRRKMGIIIPDSYAGREGVFIDSMAEDLSGRLLKVYSGRGVDEKLGLEGAHTNGNLQNRAKQGIVTVLQANKQFYRGTNFGPDGSVFLVNRLIQQAGDINRSESPGKMFVEDAFGPEHQLLLLAAADIVVLDSKTLKMSGVLLPTGASESTEVDGLALFQGPPELHGFINNIRVFGRIGKGQGTLFTPADEREETYRDLDNFQANMWREGKISPMLFSAIKEFRVTDTRLTASLGYAPMWEATIAAEEARRKKLLQAGTPSLVDILKDEYRSLRRPEREVFLPGSFSASVLRRVDNNLELREDLIVLGKTVFLSPIEDAGAIELTFKVNSQGIHPNMVMAFLSEKGFVDRRYPMSLIKIDGDGGLIFSVQVPAKRWRQWRDGMPLEFSATGGSWYERFDVSVSHRLPQNLKEKVQAGVSQYAAAHDGRGFDIFWKGSSSVGARRLSVIRGSPAEFHLELPLGERTLARHLMVVPYVMNSASQWAFLKLSDYTVSNIHLTGDKLTLDFKIHQILNSAAVTFALIDAGDSSYNFQDKDKVIAWANPPGDDIALDIQNLHDRALSTEGDSAELSTPGGIALAVSDNDRTVITDGMAQGVFNGEIPLQWNDISGVTPELSTMQMTVNVPLIFGLSTPKG